MNLHPLFRKTLVIFLWLLIWEAISQTVGNSILLVGPINVMYTLAAQIPTADFWKTIFGSLGKISLGFCLAFLSGIFLGILAFRFSFLKELLAQLVTLMKSVRIPFFRKIRFLYLPSLMPYLISGCQVALGMSWKSGVAAEVIGTPAYSIGKQLYLSKTWLDTGNLFCWTLVIILVSSAFERLVLFLLKHIPHCTPYNEDKTLSWNIYISLMETWQS